MNRDVWGHAIPGRLKSRSARMNSGAIPGPSMTPSTCWDLTLRVHSHNVLAFMTTCVMIFGRSTDVLRRRSQKSPHFLLRYSSLCRNECASLAYFCTVALHLPRTFHSEKPLWVATDGWIDQISLCQGNWTRASQIAGLWRPWWRSDTGAQRRLLSTATWCSRTEIRLNLTTIIVDPPSFSPPRQVLSRATFLHV